MSQRQQHTIGRLVLELNTNEQQQNAPARQEQWAALCRERLPALLDRCLDEWSEPDFIYQLERIEINIEGLNLEYLATEWEEKVEQPLILSLRKAFQQENPGRTKREQNAAGVLIFFLEKGRIPWWTDTGKDVIRNAILAFTSNTVSIAPSDRIDLIRVLAETEAQQRLTHATDDTELLALVRVLAEPALAEATKSFFFALSAAIPVWHVARRRFWPAVFQVLVAGPQRDITLAGLLRLQLQEYLPETGGGNALFSGKRQTDTARKGLEIPMTDAQKKRENERTLNQGLPSPEEHLVTPSTDKQTISEMGASLRDKQKLPETDRPLPEGQVIPETDAASSDKQKLAKTDALLPNKQMISENEGPLREDQVTSETDAPSFDKQKLVKTDAPLSEEQMLPETDAGLPDKQTAKKILEGDSLMPPADDLQSRTKESLNLALANTDPLISHPLARGNSSRDFDESDRLYLQNAGLVLLAPYLPMLWERLEWVRDREFAGPTERFLAIELCQFLCDGQGEPPEYELILPKILCGLSPDTLYAPERTLNQEERSEGEALLESVIKHAAGLGLKTIDGLRGSFLLRKGVLRSGGNHWILHVEKESYDIVLQQVPWNFQIVKYPWMEVPVMVDWVV